MFSDDYFDDILFIFQNYCWHVINLLNFIEFPPTVLKANNRVKITTAKLKVNVTPYSS